MTHVHLNDPGLQFLLKADPNHENVQFTPLNWLRWTIVILPALFVSALYIQPWVEPRWLFLDTLTAVDLSGACCHVYYGLASNLGIMLWTATSAVCLFAALILHRKSDFVSTHRKAFALIAGMFTGWLALDDAFLVHEKVFPALGLPQATVLLVYAILGLVYALYARRIALQVDYILFILAGGFLASSMMIDHFHHGLTSDAIFLEDGAKFIGICCWAGFHISAMFHFLRAIDARQESAPNPQEEGSAP